MRWITRARSKTDRIACPWLIRRCIDPEAEIASIVHAADISGLDSDPLGPGLIAIGEGGLDAEPDDQRLVERGESVYDALFARCRGQTAPAGGAS